MGCFDNRNLLGCVDFEFLGPLPQLDQITFTLKLCLLERRVQQLCGEPC